MSTDRLGELFDAVTLEGSPPGTLHRRLYAELRRAIHEGRLAPGARLPSTRAMAARLCVSRNTVIAAFAQLEAEGHLSSRTGSGTFVTAREETARVRRPVQQGGGAAPAEVPLAQRGRAVAGAVALVEMFRHRHANPARPFRVGVPALEDLPIAQWRRCVAQALRHMPVNAFGDSDPAGLDRLRAAIADYLGNHRGIACDPARIVVTSGSQQALDLIARVTTDPGDTVWMEDPGYIGAAWCFRAAGVDLRGLPVDAEGIRVPEEREAGEPRLVYCTPASQMPLGMPMSLARRGALLAAAARHRAWIVEDDYDSEYRYGTRPFPTLFESDQSGRVIYLGTFSKTLFPGMRIGFAILPEALVDAVTAARLVSTWHPPTLEQYALAAFIESGGFARHVRRSRARYAERAGVLAESCARWLPEAARLHAPRSGLSAWLETRDGLDGTAFAHAAARKGLELMPVSAFAVERPQARGFVLGFAPHPPQALREGVRALAALLEARR